MAGVEKRNPGEPEFVQAVYEVASTIFPYIADKPIYHEAQAEKAWSRLLTLYKSALV